MSKLPSKFKHIIKGKSCFLVEVPILYLFWKKDILSIFDGRCLNVWVSDIGFEIVIMSINLHYQFNKKNVKLISMK